MFRPRVRLERSPPASARLLAKQNLTPHPHQRRVQRPLPRLHLLPRRRRLRLRRRQRSKSRRCRRLKHRIRHDESLPALHRARRQPSFFTLRRRPAILLRRRRRRSSPDHRSTRRGENTVHSSTPFHRRRASFALQSHRRGSFPRQHARARPPGVQSHLHRRDRVDAIARFESDVSAQCVALDDECAARGARRCGTFSSRRSAPRHQ